MIPMLTRPSRILRLLREGQLPTVLKMNLSDPRVVEIAGLCGVDAVWLCTEHIPNDWVGIENQVRAARAQHIDTLVRVGRGSYSDYIRPLEADATGIIVPHVANEQEARQIVDWVRFHPLGKRAFDGGNADGAYCLTPIKEYIEHANRERLVILQIESPEALEHVEKIASLPGFNGLLFGPGDFSHRIGQAGNINAPEVVAARKRVARAAQQHGKFAMTSGLLAPLPELVAEGHQVIGIGADIIGLSGYFKQQLEFVRQQIQTMPPNLKPSNRSPYG